VRVGFNRPFRTLFGVPRWHNKLDTTGSKLWPVRDTCCRNSYRHGPISELTNTVVRRWKIEHDYHWRFYDTSVRHVATTLSSSSDFRSWIWSMVRLQWEECVQLAQWIEANGASILNTGIGWHEARVPTISTTVPRGAFVQPTAALKATGLIRIPLVATNRINTPQVAEDILTSHSSDLVSMARPLLADPDFLSKARRGTCRRDQYVYCLQSGMFGSCLCRQDCVVFGQSSCRT
jgi:hypothetical protein